MRSVVVLDDDRLARDGIEMRETRSARVIRALIARGVHTYLFDGLAVRDCQRVADRYSEAPGMVCWSNQPDVLTLVNWLKQKFGNELELGLVIDLQFGSDAQYGEKVFEFLQGDQDFTPQLNAVIYSKLVDEELRRELVRRLGISGDRILNRNTETAEDVVKFF